MAFRNNSCLIIFAIFISAILAVSLVQGVGISKYYYKGEPLKIGSGESKSVPIALFMASGEKQDRNLAIEMVNDGGIAKVINSEVKVPAGSIDRQINLKFSVEKGVPEGTEYQVDLRVKDETASEEAGMIGFNSVKMVSFPVIVSAPEKPETNFLMWLLFIVIVLIIIVILYSLLKKKFKNNKKSR